MALKITEVEVKDHVLAFEMRVVRGLYYPTPTKGYTKSLTLCVIFLYAKKSHFALRFYI